MQKSKLLIIVIATLLLLSACTSKHTSRAILYKEDNHGIYSLVMTTGKPDNPMNGRLIGGNPIFLPANSVYDLTLEELRPGWFHLPNKRISTSAFSMPQLDTKDWDLAQEEYLQGREIWLVTEITQLNPSDPLELSSGRYISASNVKLDMISFGAIPLSKDEKKVFHIDRSSNYRISFKVYEVNGIAFKQALAKIYNNPGLVGIANSSFDTVKQIFVSIVGPTVFHTDDKGTLLIEQALLESDGSLEFKGTINVLRTDAEKADTEFLLYDVVKSDPFRTNKCVEKFNDSASYDNALATFLQNCKVLNLKNETKADHYSYLKFSVDGWELKE